MALGLLRRPPLSEPRTPQRVVPTSHVHQQSDPSHDAACASRCSGAPSDDRYPLCDGDGDVRDALPCDEGDHHGQLHLGVCDGVCDDPPASRAPLKQADLQQADLQQADLLTEALGCARLDEIRHRAPTYFPLARRLELPVATP